MAAPPELIDDLTAEILLRIPPDEPAHLVRASLVCKPWRRLLTGPAFLRRYRAFHRTPPMLGFIHNYDHYYASPSSAPRFNPTTAASPFSPLAIGSTRLWRALDCRHGRVLIHRLDPMELMVWNPITGDQRRFPLPPHPHAHCTGAVLCAARDCDHLDCHQDPFLVVFVGTGKDDQFDSWACLYSSETGQWSSQAFIVIDSYVDMLPSLLIQDTLYFNFDDSFRILGYDIDWHELWEIDAPIEGGGFEEGRAMTAEDGGLGYASMEDLGLVLWSWYVGDDGIGEWVQLRVIELNMLIPVGNPSLAIFLVGCIEDTQTIFISSDVGLFAIELESGQMKKLGERRTYHAVIPYMSFYTSDLAMGRLAQPTGMQ